MAAEQFNFSERELDRWVKATLATWAATPETIPSTGQALIADRGGPASVPGLFLRIRLGRSAGAWSLVDPVVGFYVVKKIDGKNFTRLIGDRRITGVERARDAARALLDKLAQGQDPKEDRRQAREVDALRALTYRDALEAFLAEADIAEGTRKKYRLSLSTTFKEVADKPLVYFTEDRVKAIHRSRSTESRSRADQDMRVLRLVWNWAARRQTTDDGRAVLGDNPVVALNKAGRVGGERGWNSVPRKESIIPRGRLPDWFRAVRQIGAEPEITGARRTTCLLLEALCLTGLRFNELATATWSQVDLAMGTLTVPDTTSKNRRPLVRPLTRRFREVLESTGTRDAGELIFRGRRAGLPLHDTRPTQVEIQTRTGLWITPHDLRRVWASAATRAGLPAIALKRLLNHVGPEDVTDGYVRLGLDELLDAAQSVENTLLGDAGLLASKRMDEKLADLLAGLPEDERRRLLFDLSQRQADRREVG